MHLYNLYSFYRCIVCIIYIINIIYKNENYLIIKNIGGKLWDLEIYSHLKKEKQPLYL